MTTTGSAGQSAPEVTVVVVNYNAGAYLAGCIQSLERQTFRNFEVILIDNASGDDSPEALSFRPDWLRILPQATNLGFAAANNIGAREGRGTWLALLNPDAEAAPDWIERQLDAVARRPTHRVVASVQIDLNDPNRLDGAGDCYAAFGMAWRGGFGSSVAAVPDAGECFAPCGAAAFYPRQVFLDAGGFDERYFCYHEDVDLGFRLRLLGERCQFDPACVVRHVGSAISGRHSDFSIFHGARNGVWTYVKNMPGPLLALTLPAFVLAHLPLLVRNGMRGSLGAQLRGIGAAVASLGAVLKDRRRVQEMRTASYRAIARALVWNPARFLGRRICVAPFAAEDAGDLP